MPSHESGCSSWHLSCTRYVQLHPHGHMMNVPHDDCMRQILERPMLCSALTARCELSRYRFSCTHILLSRTGPEAYSCSEPNQGSRQRWRWHQQDGGQAAGRAADLHRQRLLRGSVTGRGLGVYGGFVDKAINFCWNLATLKVGGNPYQGRGGITILASMCGSDCYHRFLPRRTLSIFIVSVYVQRTCNRVITIFKLNQTVSITKSSMPKLLIQCDNNRRVVRSRSARRYQ